MAHQTHTIPWQTLSDNLRYVYRSSHKNCTTNLYLRKRKRKGAPDVQEKEIRYFVRGFVQALEDYSAIERSKYDSDHISPEIDEILISNATVRKIAPTVLKYKAYGKPVQRGTYALSNILTPAERSARRWVQDTAPGEGDMHDSLRGCCELTKTLLLYNEMSTLLRLAAHPDIRFHKLWDERQYANSHDFGLDKLVEASLQSYICLNILSLRPELYDQKSWGAFVEMEGRGRRRVWKREECDYRLTKAYQHMLLSCTAVPYAALCDVHMYPHREFFGIPKGMFQVGSVADPRWRHLGTQPLAELTHKSFRSVHVPSKSDTPAFENIYLPSKADTSQVINMLGKKGLPTELALHVMELAEYESVGRTWIRDDPLHIENAEELKKYLAYCWKLLVRVELLMKADGKSIDWETAVMDTLCLLFDMPGRSKLPNRSVWDYDFGGNRRKVWLEY